MKRLLLLGSILALCALGVAVYLYVTKEEPLPEVPIASSEPVHTVVGTSIEGRTIDAYTYGQGETELLFVGGMHGGYEWNSVLLAFAFMDHLRDHSDTLPHNLKVTVIPSLNPDGVYEVVKKEGRFLASEVPSDTPTAPGRFNAREVDLNRNFDCKWQPDGTWRGNEVSAGTEAFSEPESQALRDFVVGRKPVAVIFWHSQANAVYASECESGILSDTLGIMKAYASAAGYPAVESFDAYSVTGDAEGWLASIGIPAITVELSSHETIEWEKNIAGIEALFNYYSTKAK